MAAEHLVSDRSEKEMHQTDFCLCGLKIFFGHILISLASFVFIPLTVRIFYNTSLLAESKAFPKSINNLTYCPIALPLFLQYLTNTEHLISS
jgi:hypothetical protein